MLRSTWFGNLLVGEIIKVPASYIFTRYPLKGYFVQDKAPLFQSAVSLHAALSSKEKQSNKLDKNTVLSLLKQEHNFICISHYSSDLYWPSCFSRQTSNLFDIDVYFFTKSFFDLEIERLPLTYPELCAMYYAHLGTFLFLPQPLIEVIVNYLATRYTANDNVVLDCNQCAWIYLGDETEDWSLSLTSRIEWTKKEICVFSLELPIWRKHLDFKLQKTTDPSWHPCKLKVVDFIQKSRFILSSKSIIQ